MKIFGCFFGHKVKIEQHTTREFYGSYSPKEGTKVTKNYYICCECGKDLTSEYEYMFWQQSQPQEAQHKQLISETIGEALPIPPDPNFDVVTYDSRITPVNKYKKELRHAFNLKEE